MLIENNNNRTLRYNSARKVVDNISNSLQEIGKAYEPIHNELQIIELDQFILKYKEDLDNTNKQIDEIKTERRGNNLSYLMTINKFTEEKEKIYNKIISEYRQHVLTEDGEIPIIDDIDSDFLKKRIKSIDKNSNTLKNYFESLSSIQYEIKNTFDYIKNSNLATNEIKDSLLTDLEMENEIINTMKRGWNYNDSMVIIEPWTY